MTSSSPTTPDDSSRFLDLFVRLYEMRQARSRRYCYEAACLVLPELRHPSYAAACRHLRKRGK